MDEQIWFYIIAALIYFLTRKKKKPQQQPTNKQTSSTNQKPAQKPISFEDLLKEITEQREPEEERIEIEEEPIEVITEQEKFEKEGRTRSFADDESKKIYQESIERAKEVDHKFERDEHYSQVSLLKSSDEPEEPSIADEIRADLQSIDSARKAIIYSEILTRRY